MSWESVIPAHERGEVGRVLFLNMMCIRKDGEEWTRNEPITLNPDRGSTIERMLTKASDIPQPMKSDLLAYHKAEARLTGGLLFRMWLSDYPAPDYWNPTPAQKARRRAQEGRGLLFDANGNVL